MTTPIWFTAQLYHRILTDLLIFSKCFLKGNALCARGAAPGAWAHAWRELGLTACRGTKKGRPQWPPLAQTDLLYWMVKVVLVVTPSQW